MFVFATVSVFWSIFALLSTFIGLFSLGGGLVILAVLIRIAFLKLTHDQYSSLLVLGPIIIADILFNIGALVGVHKSIAMGVFIWQYLFYPPAFILLVISYIVLSKLIVKFFVERKAGQDVL